MNASTPQIGQYCTIASDVEFGSGVIIHGFANLYGCRIGDNCRIGTFVEIQKDAVLGKRIRVQSHSFICSDVIIEDDVFIGSDCQLIAPIKIGKGSSIGAGSTIAKDVPEGQLTINRPNKKVVKPKFINIPK